MTCRCSPRMLSIGMSAFLLLLGPGCATNKDLKNLNRGLTNQIETMNSSLQADLTKLRSQLEEGRAAQERLDQDLAKSLDALRSSLDGLRSDTKAAVAQVLGEQRHKGELLRDLKAESSETRQVVVDYAGTSNQALERIATTSEALHHDVGELQTAVATTQQLPSLVRNLGAEMRALRKALYESYKLEEAALRERLKALQQLNVELEVTAARQDSASATAH